MRIDTTVQMNSNVGAVGAEREGNITGRTLKENLFGDAGTTTMNSTTMAKNSIVGALSEDGSLESVKETASTLKDNLNAMLTKMDTGDVVTMDEDGVDVNDLEPEEIVTVVEQIQIKLATWCDDFSLVGTDVSLDDIKSVAGGSANAYKIAASMAEAGMEPTQSRVTEAEQALDTYETSEVPGDETKAYLLKNNLEPTIRNLYLAENSVAGMTPAHPLAESEWQQIRPQVEDILAKTPMAGDSALTDRARMLIENEIEITPEKLEKLESLDDMTEKDSAFALDRILATMIEGRQALDTNLTGETLPWEEAANAVYTLQKAEPENIMSWVELSQAGETDGSVRKAQAGETDGSAQKAQAESADGSAQKAEAERADGSVLSEDSDSQTGLTLDSLSDIEFLNRKAVVDETNPQYIKATRQVMEARLLMTLEAGRTLEKQGISINTLEISDLIDRLKELEQNSLTVSTGGNNGQAVTDAEIDRITEVSLAYEDLKSAPHVVLGSVIKEGLTPSVNNLTEAALPLKNQLKKADDAYEALQTEVRSDLGDSLKKAVVQSTSEILSGLGYEETSENRRAVRILAYNQLEMSEENMARVKNLDSSVNRLFNELTPNKTLQMLRTGIDPLNTGVDELAAYLAEQTDTAADEEKYSQFLYRQQESGQVTEEERSQYIGIYSMIHKLESDGLTAVGGVLKQGSDLTMGNLLTAYLSGKDKNTEYTVSDVMEDMTVKDTASYYRNIFAGLTKLITPDNLAEAWKGDGEVSVEAFAQNIRESAMPDREDPVYAAQTAAVEEAAESSTEVLQFVSEYGISPTLYNLRTTARLLREPESLWPDYAATEGEDLSTAEGLTEATGKAYTEEFATALGDSAKMQAVYQDLAAEADGRVKEAMYETGNFADFATLREMSRGMSIMAELATRNNYYLPYEKEDGTQGVMNVRILSHSDQPGRFSLKVRGSETYGNATVEGLADGNRVRVHMMSDSREGLAALEKQTGTIKEQLTGLGYEAQLTTGLVASQPEGHAAAGESADTDRLLSLAKIFVQELTKIN